ncbi:MAG: myo-inositol 2-dehydrogenase / D-chiro-inositol 1-dehydrogenase [Pseudonocardiales bacterium]|jgi:myo-inositol 2-dehydrogenase/D-chiro-inositol 1-dehydrogenase|nr:myo-inositol 2-dehydrogenase / D-chiro-inositol 1-dehydrogenase [Pseudonocardiales bacterium]
MGATSRQSPTTCRIGFVGTGGVARRHAGVLRSFADVDLVGATDVDPDRAEAFVAQYGGQAVPGTDALIGLGLDALYICVPPFAHGGPESAAVNAGVAAFVEKPLAADVGTAETVAGLLAAGGITTRVGLHWRCAEPVRRAYDLLKGRRVRLVGGWWLDKVPPVPWWGDRHLSGGPLVEQAVHVLDLMRLLVGEVSEVHAVSAGPAGSDTDAATAALLRFAGGAVGTIATTCVLSGKHRAGVEIVADGLVVGVGEDWLEVGDGVTSRRSSYDPSVARAAADRAFVDAVRNPASPADHTCAPTLPDHTEALNSHRLACALARSAQTGAPEHLR